MIDYEDEYDWTTDPVEALPEREHMFGLPDKPKNMCSNCHESTLTIEDVGMICHQCRLDRTWRPA